MPEETFAGRLGAVNRLYQTADFAHKSIVFRSLRRQYWSEVQNGQWGRIPSYLAFCLRGWLGLKLYSLGDRCFTLHVRLMPKLPPA